MSNTRNHDVAPNPTRLTLRGKILAGALVVSAVVGGAAEARHLSGESKEQKRIAYNTGVIEHASQMLDGNIILGAGVHARSTPEVKQDGDPELDQISNAVLTVKKGQELSIVRPLIVDGKDGKQWIAFEKPSDKGASADTQTLKERAENLEFVALQQIQEETPHLVHIQGYDKDPSDINMNPRMVSIDAQDTGQGVMFENAGSDFMYGYVGTSAVVSDTGK